MMIIDYVPAKECRNTNVWYSCHKCGACGRKFEDGFMVDDGGTIIAEEEGYEDMDPHEIKEHFEA